MTHKIIQHVISCLLIACLCSNIYAQGSEDKSSAGKDKYNPGNILGFSGSDIGLQMKRYNVIPKDPETGNSLLIAGSNDKNKVLQHANIYLLDVNLYKSFIGNRLYKKKDPKIIVADISELGISIGGASEDGQYFDGTPVRSASGKTGPNHTVAANVNAAIGLMAVYKINPSMRVSLRYQYLIDQGVVFYSRIGLDKPHQFDMSRKRIKGTFSYSQYLFEANVGLPWKYADGADMKHANKGWGLGVEKRTSTDRHIGVRFDFVYIRDEYSGSGTFRWATRNVHSIAFYYGVGI